jgi:putative transposase
MAAQESAQLAERLLADSITKQGIDRDPLVIHADRDSSMASKPVAFLLADLGVAKSHSRPHCPNDNPFSDSQFKTLKYRPDFPERFGSKLDARDFWRIFFPWYNNEHRHSGIGRHTPADLHHGPAEIVRARRDDVLTFAYGTHPERFVRKRPEPPQLSGPARINRPVEEVSTQ